MERIKVEVIMNEEFRIVSDEKGNKKVVDGEGKDATFIDAFSNTYPRPIKTIIGKINNIENALIYIISDNMPLMDMKKPYPYLVKDIKKYLRRTHHVSHFNIIELIITTDSILSDKNLVADILEYEDFKDLNKVDLLSVIKVKSGFISTLEPYHKRKNYAKTVKKVLWEIKNAFDDLNEISRENGLIKEDEELSPEVIRNYNNEDYKIFKNAVKEIIADIIVERIGEEANILEGVRGAKELLAKDLKDVWLK